MEIEVGDRVTYKYKNYNTKYGEIVTSELEKEALLSRDNIEILKIERPNWEAVEEKKELLTEEEKEFLKQYLIHSSNEYEKEYLIKRNKSIWLENKNTDGICFQYNKNKFKGLVDNKEYTLQELRIGGLNGRRYKKDIRICSSK